MVLFYREGPWKRVMVLRRHGLSTKFRKGFEETGVRDTGTVLSCRELLSDDQNLHPQDYDPSLGSRQGPIEKLKDVPRIVLKDRVKGVDILLSSYWMKLPTDPSDLPD